MLHTAPNMMEAKNMLKKVRLTFLVSWILTLDKIQYHTGVSM